MLKQNSFLPPLNGWGVRTAPGFSLGCKTKRSLGLYESCKEDEDSLVEVLAAIVVSAIKGKWKAWRNVAKIWGSLNWESLKKSNNGGQEEEILNFDKP